MITRQKAFDFVSALRDIQEVKHRNERHSVPEWLIIIRRQLQKAEDAWYQGKQTIALHEIGEATACGVAALEQNGEDGRVAANAGLKPLPVTCKSMEPGKLYIWSTRENDGVLVMLNPDGDGMCEVHKEEDWYFQDQLIGRLYGPIALLPA